MVKKLTILNVLGPFLNQPKEKIHLADISRELKEPHPTVRLKLNMLEKEGVLRKESRGRQTLYSLNLENANIIDYVLISEKNNLIKRCADDLILRELTQFIHQNFGENVKALIFGSAANSFKKANDIDILVVGKIKVKNLERFGERLNKKLHIIQSDYLSKISETLRQEIIKKHLLIKGSEDIIKWFLWNKSSGVQRKI